MPARTPTGLPYPLPTDQVAGLPATFREFAESVDKINALPMARAVNTATTAITNGGYLTLATATTSGGFDTDGLWNPATPTRLTAKAAGIYMAAASLKLTHTPASLQWVYVELMVNETTIAASSQYTAPINGNEVRASIAVPYPLVPGDYVGCRVAFPPAGTATIDVAIPPALSLICMRRTP